MKTVFPGREILVLSGKGGSGKTFLASSLIEMMHPCVACDYDVDASNLFILFPSQEIEVSEYTGGKLAFIDANSCIDCGLCESMCAFHAIEEQKVKAMFCEGCGLCTRICPVGAVRLIPRNSGRWYRGKRDSGEPILFAELRPGEENSGKLVACLKDRAREEAARQQLPLIISDGPPGLGCPVISALSGADLVVMVAEPSVSGSQDLKRLHELLQARAVSAVLVINKSDLNPEGRKHLVSWAREENIPIIGMIPFCQEVFSAIRQGISPVSYPAIRELLKPICDHLNRLKSN